MEEQRCAFSDCSERATYFHDAPGLGTSYYCSKHRCVYGCEVWHG